MLIVYDNIDPYLSGNDISKTSLPDDEARLKLLCDMISMPIIIGTDDSCEEKRISLNRSPSGNIISATYIST